MFKACETQPLNTRLWSSYEENKVLDALEQGLNVQTIVENHGRATDNIYSKICEMALKMYMNDKPIEEIMRKTTLSEETINDLIERRKYEANPYDDFTTLKLRIVKIQNDVNKLDEKLNVIIQLLQK